MLTVIAAEEERPIPSGRLLFIEIDILLTVIENRFSKNKHDPIIKSDQSFLLSNFFMINESLY